MPSIKQEVVLDIFLRLLSCACVTFFVVNALTAYATDRSRITLAIVVISEITIVVISLISRRPQTRDWHWLTVMATVFAGGLWAPLISFDPHTDLLGETFSAALQCAGLIWEINAKLTLGRSFGWLPANRGIVDAGVYRIVRHPIYFGYMITHIGFLGANFNLQNVLIFTLFYVAQIYRIYMEEAFLMLDEAYRNYATRVPYRLIYGIF